eukprot:7112234-Pyramimonas_sp.AAC.1
MQKIDNICQDDSKNANSFADLARVADPVQTWMQQTNEADDSESVSVRMSSAAIYSPSYVRERTEPLKMTRYG